MGSILINKLNNRWLFCYCSFSFDIFSALCTEIDATNVILTGLKRFACAAPAA